MALGFLLDFACSHELGVEITGRKTETRAFIVTDDFADIASAGITHRARHTVCTMVVGSQGERPGAQHLIVILEYFEGSMGGFVRVEPFIHESIDPHIWFG